MNLSKTGVIIDWVRHNGVEQIAVRPEYEKRIYLYPSPVLRQNMSELLNYETNKELAISVTLGYRSDRSLYYTESIVKQACWLFKLLCDRTDVIEEGVQLRLGITSDLSRMASPYLGACNFPDSNIDWLDSREAVYPLSTKFIHMKHDSLKDFERVYHMDIAFHFDTDETQHKGDFFRDIKRIWNGQPLALPMPMLRKRENTDYEIMKRWNEHWGDDTPAEDNLLWQALSKYTSEPASMVKHFFIEGEQILEAPGGMFGLSGEFLDALNLDKDIYPIMRLSNDECALTALAYREKWSNGDVADLGPAIKWIDAEERYEPHSRFGMRYTDQRMDMDHWMEQYG